MEEKQNPELHPEQPYEERPRWQVWCARLALVIFIGFVILQVSQIYRGFR